MGENAAKRRRPGRPRKDDRPPEDDGSQVEDAEEEKDAENGKAFLVTLSNFPIVKRDQTIVYFRELPGVRQLIVGFERHKNYDNHHCHIAVKFAEETGWHNFRNQISRSDLFQPEDKKIINIQSKNTTKKWSSACNYCTKEDRNAYIYNVPESELSFVYRLERYFQTHTTFSETHYFVVNNHTRQRHIDDYFVQRLAEVGVLNEWRDAFRQADRFDSEYVVKAGTWLYKLQQWAKDCPVRIPTRDALEVANDPFINGARDPNFRNNHGYSSNAAWRRDDDIIEEILRPSTTATDLGTMPPKTRCLYLWGGSGLGKSYNVQTLFPAAKAAAYNPVLSSKFPFNNFDRARHYVVYLPDAPSFQVWLSPELRETFLRLAEEGRFTIDVKHGKHHSVLFDGALVVVSNERPPFEEESKGFERRFTVIKADVPWTDCVVKLLPQQQVAAP